MDVTLTCCVCGTQFQRRSAEVRRNERLGRRVYCSRECCGKDNLDNIPKEKIKGWKELGLAGRKADELSPFRYHMHRMRSHEKIRKRGLRIEVSELDLKELWEKQHGKCPYTGWNLILAASTSTKTPLTPDRASVDRIDSSKGYTKDNIQFVSFMAQIAKNKFSGQELCNFCKSVTENLLTSPPENAHTNRKRGSRDMTEEELTTLQSIN